MKISLKKSLVACSMAVLLGGQVVPTMPIDSQIVQAAESVSITVFSRTSTTGGKVSYKKVADAKKYQIRYADNSAFSNCEKLQTTSLSKGLSNEGIFRDSKNAWVSIRFYDGSTWSAWSSAKKLTSPSSYVWKKVKVKDAWVETKTEVVCIVDGKEYYTNEDACQAQKELVRRVLAGELPEDYNTNVVTETRTKKISHPATYAYRWTKVS